MKMEGYDKVILAFAFDHLMYNEKAENIICGKEC
jgi:hypothetical protein